MAQLVELLKKLYTAEGLAAVVPKHWWPFPFRFGRFGSSLHDHTTNNKYSADSNTSKMPWPKAIVDQFNIYEQAPSEDQLYGSYNKLLGYLFPADSQYTVAPQPMKTGSLKAADRAMSFEVVRGNDPVFVLQVHEPRDSPHDSKQAVADKMIRERSTLLARTSRHRELSNPYICIQANAPCRSFMQSVRWGEPFVSMKSRAATRKPRDQIHKTSFFFR